MASRTEVQMRAIGTIMAEEGLEMTLPETVLA